MHTRIKNYMLLEEIYRQASEGDIDTVLRYRKGGVRL